CLLATVLPGGWSVAGLRVLALGTALAIAFVIYFYVFPPDRVGAFRRCLRLFCAAAAGELRDLLAGRAAGRDERSIEALILVNQALADALPEGPESERMQGLLRDQYDVHQALRLLRDAAPDGLPAALACTAGE